jgi:hypothetical protein
VLYYRGRAQEALHSPAAEESYRAYLALRGDAAGDALAQDARRRIGSK